MLTLALGLSACGGNSDSGTTMTGSGQDPLGGRTSVQTADPSAGSYVESPEALADGASLYQVYCVRCHGAQGEGGIGPSFRDKEFVYGGDTKQVFASIAEGRPKGMPAHGDLLASQQIWHLVAFIESLSKSKQP
jgi:cytochrome c oxidase cbb3-type subunit 3